MFAAAVRGTGSRPRVGASAAALGHRRGRLRQGRSSAGRPLPLRQRRLAGEDRRSRPTAAPSAASTRRSTARRSSSARSSKRHRSRRTRPADQPSRSSETSSPRSWTRRALNAAGKTPLEPELARIDALATKADLARHMARMMMLNMTTLVGGYVDGDAQAPTTSVLYFVAERARASRSRLLPEGRSEAEGVPAEVLGVCRQDARARRPAGGGRPPPETSSRSKPASRVRTGRTSRAAMRSRPTTR